MASFPCSVSYSLAINLFPSVKTTITKKNIGGQINKQNLVKAHFTSDVPKAWSANHQWSARYIRVDCEQGYIPH